MKKTRLTIPLNETDAFCTLTTINSLDVSVGRDMFVHYKEKGVIRKGEFEDNKWKCTNQVKNTTLKFSIAESAYEGKCENLFGISYSQFIAELKVYILYKLKLNTLSVVAVGLRVACAFVRELCENDANDMIQAFRFVKEDADTFIAEFFSLASVDERIVEQILLAIQEQRAEKLIDRRKRVSQRELASITTYTIFNEVLQDYWREINDSDFVEFFPVFLWWSVSMIIPLRVTELLLTPLDCIYKEGEACYLLLRRTRLKSDKGKQKIVTHTIQGDYYTTTYRITEALYGQIERYLSLTTNKIFLRNRDTLLLPNGRKKAVNEENLGRLIHTFQITVMCEQYQCELIDKNVEPENIRQIHLINAGDTRHLAQIALLQQGNSVTACQLLAGHLDSCSSNHYYTNLQSVARNLLSAEYVVNHTEQASRSSLQLASREYRGLHYAERVDVGHGWCYSHDVASGNYTPCMRVYDEQSGMLFSCVSCPYYTPKTEKIFSTMDNAEKQVEDTAAFLEYIIQQYQKGRAGLPEMISAHARMQASMQQYRRIRKEDKVWQDDHPSID